MTGHIRVTSASDGCVTDEGVGENVERSDSYIYIYKYNIYVQVDLKKHVPIHGIAGVVRSHFSDLSDTYYLWCLTPLGSDQLRSDFPSRSGPSCSAIRLR